MVGLGLPPLTGSMTTHPVTTWLLVAATITSGLAAGLLFAFAVAVMPGLRRTDDQAFVSVMQSINRSILNPWFLTTFLGAPVLAIAVVGSWIVIGGQGPWWPQITAAVLSLLSLLVTAAANIPLNTALDTAGTTDPATARRTFERPWVRFNMLRAVLTTASFGFLVVGLVPAQ